jgi:arsenite methyltransferase
MPSLSVIKTLCREIVTRERSKRVNEPDLVMDDPEKVAAYLRAGREDGVMAPVYLYHCAQMCDIVRGGDIVLDLGCGPATQLALVARLNRTTRFIGLDMSPPMLTRAQAYSSDQGLDNIEFRTQDITRLDGFSDHSVDAVVSTVALHHLPDFAALEAVFREVQRVLKPGGGVYLVDFGHLKAERSIQTFGNQYADRQSELFTQDYIHSLRAAFSPQEFRRLTQSYLAGTATFYSTFIMPYMMVAKSRSRSGGTDPQTLRELHRLRDSMPIHHRKDLADLALFFRLGGLPCPLLA